MPTTLHIQVVGISILSDVASNAPIAAITFGRSLESTPEILSRIPEAQRPLPSAGRINVNDLILLLPMTGTVPYRLGSKWVVVVDDNGRIDMREDAQ